MPARPRTTFVNEEQMDEQRPSFLECYIKLKDIRNNKEIQIQDPEQEATWTLKFKVEKEEIFTYITKIYLQCFQKTRKGSRNYSVILVPEKGIFYTLAKSKNTKSSNELNMTFRFGEKQGGCPECLLVESLYMQMSPNEENGPIKSFQYSTFECDGCKEKMKEDNDNSNNNQNGGRRKTRRNRKTRKH